MQASYLIQIYWQWTSSILLSMFRYIPYRHTKEFICTSLIGNVLIHRCLCSACKFVSMYLFTLQTMLGHVLVILLVKRCFYKQPAIFINSYFSRCWNFMMIEYIKQLILKYIFLYSIVFDFIFDFIFTVLKLSGQNWHHSYN